MKKKVKMIQVTAAVFAVIFCTLLGCERKEKEEDEFLLLLDEESAGGGGPAKESDQSTGAGQNGQSTAQSGPETGSYTMEQASAGSGDKLLQVDTVSAGQPQQAGRDALTSPDESETEDKALVVHICGAVREPGVYIMDEGSRIYQAVEKAGGFEAEADENYLNQADLLSDGMKIYVPTKAEVEASGGEIEWKTSGNFGAEAAGGKESGEALKESGLPVNINTAGEAELTTIPGVGSSKAKSIIAYREKNGMYRTIEDIMNVEGIKDGVFQKIKDYITV